MLMEDDDSPPNPLRSFDAFPKVHQSYVHSRSSKGGIVSIAMFVIVTILFWTELVTWWRGTEVMKVSVEKGVGHGMQLNVDITVAMACADIDVNVLDATGDRILAGEELKKENAQLKYPNARLANAAGADGRAIYREQVQQILKAAKVRKRQRRFASKLGKGFMSRLRGEVIAGDSCRIYGQLEIHKCQGDFHITARGHGYQVFGAEHLDHEKINFTHIIDELSFGEFYPNIDNPLDSTHEIADENLYRFQYFLSVVPTVYVADDWGRKIIETNQYAVTQQSHPSHHGAGGSAVPGIFFKYDVEPLQLTIVHGHISTYRFLMRLVALVGGVMICTEWGYKGYDAITQKLDKRNRRSSSADGLLNGALEKEG